ncbi:unnamed protein product, partial [Mesorhabditis belari]|uniref:Mitochondrial chaperone BCS1 n=1 Tax=Mesorhabditis belari TaxID=2138241 RepID=A0AAF3FPY1_9BILA
MNGANQITELLGGPSLEQPLSLEKKPEGSFIDQTIKGLSSNPLFSAGAGLAGIGMAVTLLKRFAVVGSSLLRRRYIVSLQLNNEDPAYSWLLDFVNRHSNRSARMLSGHTSLKIGESGRAAISVASLPGHGNHYFSYKYRWIHCERTREEHTVSIDGRRTPFETVTLTTLGTEPKFLLRMVEDAATEALSKIDTGLVVYKALGPEWRRSGVPRPKRRLDSVVLKEGMTSRIVDDIEEFVASRKWYEERGVPYRRGYLFYGPPGTGKSSFITCLASHLGYSVCIMSLSDRLLDDDRLNLLLNTPPQNSIIILEDIDAAVTNREDPKNSDPIYQGMTRVTMSGLLNAIDGVGCAEERLLFMTTNHVERLDSALIRPGRVDVKEYFGNATQEMMENMFIRFYGDNCSADDAVEFARQAASLEVEISPATLQGHFLLYKKDPRLAISHVADMKQPLLR